ncbi:MAG: phosphatase PAP2 family protein [Acidobacteriota bacterium]
MLRALPVMTLRIPGWLRAEDAIAIAAAVLLVAAAGGRAVAEGLAINEADIWDFCFILAPLALLSLLAALSYAIGGGLLADVARQIGTFLRDWLPFLLLLMFYGAFRTQLYDVVHLPDRDRELLAIDRAFLGETPAVAAQRLASTALTNVMSLAYFLHIALPPVIAFLWYRRDRQVFREYLLAILLCTVLGAVGYLLVPAVGPQVAFPELFSVNLEGRLYAPVTGFIDATRAPRDAFPSLHVALSTIVLVYAVRFGRRSAAVTIPLVLANWLSTIYLRYHYLVDVVAGWSLLVVVPMARCLLGIERRLKAPPAAPAS